MGRKREQQGNKGAHRGSIEGVQRESCGARQKSKRFQLVLERHGNREPHLAAWYPGSAALIIQINIHP